jgi:hypothetical protein
MSVARDEVNFIAALILYIGGIGVIKVCDLSVWFPKRLLISAKGPDHDMMPTDMKLNTCLCYVLLMQSNRII